MSLASGPILFPCQYEKRFTGIASEGEDLRVPCMSFTPWWRRGTPEVSWARCSSAGAIGDSVHANVCGRRSRRLESHLDALARLGREYPLATV